MQIKINLGPLSVNKAWQGKRFKTKLYKKFEKDVLKILPNKRSLEGELFVRYVFYIKNYKMSDWDNPIKPIQDILVKKGIIKEDRFIKGGIVIKESVKDIQKEKIIIDIVLYENRMSLIKNI